MQQRGGVDDGGAHRQPARDVRRVVRHDRAAVPAAHDGGPHGLQLLRPEALRRRALRHLARQQRAVKRRRIAIRRKPVAIRSREPERVTEQSLIIVAAFSGGIRNLE